LKLSSNVRSFSGKKRTRVLLDGGIEVETFQVKPLRNTDTGFFPGSFQHSHPAGRWRHAEWFGQL
jgi:hypothetical protein